MEWIEVVVHVVIDTAVHFHPLLSSGAIHYAISCTALVWVDKEIVSFHSHRNCSKTVRMSKDTQARNVPSSTPKSIPQWIFGALSN